jgi:hypothetical protein
VLGNTLLKRVRESGKIAIKAQRYIIGLLFETRKIILTPREKSKNIFSTSGIDFFQSLLLRLAMEYSTWGKTSKK